VIHLLAIGIGAGLVSALLFGVVITGSALAMMLSFIAPMPTFIAALGWNHRAGLVAAIAGGIAMALALNPTAGAAFALGWALPAWWLGYLALLGRPGADGTTEWYPLGRLLLWIAGTAALITLIGVVALGDGSYETYRSNLSETFENFVRAQTPPQEGETAQQPGDLAGLIINALPFFFAVNFVLVLTLNLWLAGKAVQISQRLPRPWPFIPATTMPRIAIGLLIAASLLAFVDGFPGAFGMALTGALLGAFALQGLAFIHDTSMQRPGRPFLLSGIYVFALLVSSVVMPLLALLGVADVAFPLRNRFGAASGRPNPPST
jgi:Predicted membrane protein (DUF2232)